MAVFPLINSAHVQFVWDVIESSRQDKGSMHVVEHHNDLFSWKTIYRLIARLSHTLQNQAQVKKKKGEVFQIIEDSACLQRIKTMFLLCIAPDSVATRPKLSPESMSSSVTSFLHDFRVPTACSLESYGGAGFSLVSSLSQYVHSLSSPWQGPGSRQFTDSMSRTQLSLISWLRKHKKCSAKQANPDSVISRHFIQELCMYK